MLAIPPDDMVAELREELQALRAAEELWPELKRVGSGGELDHVPYYYEALLGEEHLESASEVGRLYLENCRGSGRAYVELVNRAARAESFDHARAWVDEGRRVLRGSDRRRLEKAAKRLDEAVARAKKTESPAEQGPFRR